MKKFVAKFIFLFLFFCFLTTPSALASSPSSNFSTDYDVTYTVNDNGLTHVYFDVALTNNTTEYYASSYDITVGFEDIENVTASDMDGQIIPDVTRENDEQNIKLTFNSRIVGVNNKLRFNLSFDTKSVAKKVGNIWEVNIPGLSEQGNFQSFNVHVRTPEFFGNPSYIKPEIASSRNTLDFTKEQLGKGGIYIGFGIAQIYKFDLTYHLQNSNLFKVKTEIALPPSTNYQDIQIDDINPKPLNVRIDSDGNWLADYVLSASQKIDVVVEGKAKIFLTPKVEPESPEQLKKYLQEQPYWEISNIDIKNLANTLKTPYAIYEYLVKNLTYDFSRVLEKKDRLGGAKVLKNPNSAVCLEFTDLFISLARSVGIPAREIDGFAYTKDDKNRPLSLVKDVLHAWPEYYDYEKKSWIMIDPTWGNTTRGLDYFYTLDFDHFAFVIKGKNSEYPIPAGGYKLEEDIISKDVIVGFSNNLDGVSPKLELRENFSESNFSGLPIKGQVTIKNNGKYVSESQIATVSSTFLTPTHQEFLVNKIPPFGFLAINVNFHKTPILTNLSDKVTITLNGQSVFQIIKIAPIFLHKLILAFGGISFAFITIIISIVAIRTRRLSVLKQKEQSALRWQSEEPQKKS